MNADELMDLQKVRKFLCRLDPDQAPPLCMGMRTGYGINNIKHVNSIPTYQMLKARS